VVAENLEVVLEIEFALGQDPFVSASPAGIREQTRRKGSPVPNKKQTSSPVATKASDVLRDKQATPKEKSVAASDLAQARGKGKKK